MPYRKTPLVRNEIYHIFNRSIAGMPIFLNDRIYQRALNTINFYRFEKPAVRFSHYNRLPEQQKNDFLERLKLTTKRVKILAYCLMPNHIHFVLKQLTENGIANLMSNFQESYAKYFNIRQERTGALFQSMFRAVRIEMDEQFVHVVRYVHLNPLTSFVIRDFTELENYLWCSFAEYMDKSSYEIIDKEEVMQYFSSAKKFQKFTLDQMDYQRKLNRIKHLILE